VTDNPEDFPGVEPAQSFIIPSYQWMLSRIEAADARINTLLTFFATVTFSVPTVLKAVWPELPLNSGWFIAAAVVAVSIVLYGLHARTKGGICLPHPAEFYDKWLNKSKWTFQKDALYFAGQHFETNRVLVEWKAEAVNRMSGLFAVELLLLFLWINRV
jgi:hypothetical protein